MYQLILHHVYRKGPYAIDISGAQNDGLVTAAGYIDDGVAMASGALTFKSPYARVRVPPRPLWQNLFALKIEVVVRVDALGGRMNLVEGADSFAFFVDDLGRLWGTVNAEQYPGGPLTWQGASSAFNAPDSIVRTIPVGKWVTLRFEHDGYASARLYMDNELIAANYGLSSGVPSVGAAGVNIGNWTIADQYQLNGAIDEVKIWRYDPDDCLGRFLSRDLNRKNAPCWRDYFNRLAAGLGDERSRQRVLSLMACVASAQRELLRQIRSKGEDAIAENTRLADEYREIWEQGHIDSPKMRKWQRDFMRFLSDRIGRAPLDAAIAQVKLCYARSELQAYLPKNDCNLAECDPAFTGYINGFAALVDQPFVTPRRK